MCNAAVESWCLSW